ncbi:hypothetical protein [Actinoplanes sp. NPDC049802]|uniref:hypothetical protein n=1 Tax=Actinoplanes sp. NPDC049802 TaxID=3154742 RepID=UPI0033C974B7
MTGEENRRQHMAEDEEAIRAALERALAERAAIMDAARLPGLGVPDEEPGPGRPLAPMPQRERQDR